MVMKMSHKESWEEALLRSTTKEKVLIMCFEVATEDHEKTIDAEIGRNQEEDGMYVAFRVRWQGKERIISNMEVKQAKKIMSGKRGDCECNQEADDQRGKDDRV